MKTTQALEKTGGSENEIKSCDKMTGKDSCLWCLEERKSQSTR